MSHSPLFPKVLRCLYAAIVAEERRIPAAEAMQIVRGPRPSRRQFLTTLGGGIALAHDAFAQRRGRNVNVGIVGGGLAGLMCAHELRDKGAANVTIYDAATRIGGRVHSLRDFFPGQVAERGAELIDTKHKLMHRLIKKFGLTLEDLSEQPGELTFFFDGVRVSERAIVEEFRAMVPALKRDRKATSKKPNAERNRPKDQELDRRNLLEYIESTGAPPLAFKALKQAYMAEYGLELEEQSALNFLLFVDFKGGSHFDPYGGISDERYHIVEGNDAIIGGLAERVKDLAQLSMTLRKVARTPAGGVELTLESEGRTVTRTHEAVVLAIPFTVLREVELDPSLGLPEWKARSIRELGYGTNAKMKVGFVQRPWEAIGSDGSSYSDLGNHQATWQTNPSNASADRAVLTDYSSGKRGASMNPAHVDGDAARFLADLNRIYPGAEEAARRREGSILAHLEHWPSNPLTKGSYTCYRAGQFTTLAGLEGKRAGNLFFAGEHTDSFFDWQGFMEGAARSGLRAAREILKG
jgi:monoamine oxidase